MQSQIEVKFVSGEKTGRTTRILDELVQKFFQYRLYQPLRVRDHDVPNEKSEDRKARNLALTKKLINRLYFEHGLKINKSFVIDETDEDNISIIKIKDKLSDYFHEKYLEWKSYEKLNNSYFSYFHFISGNRATGETTRLADEYIQKILTSTDKVYIHDHYGHRMADRLLANRILKRLDIEHPNEKVFHNFKQNNIWIQRKTEK